MDDSSSIPNNRPSDLTTKEINFTTMNTTEFLKVLPAYLGCSVFDTNAKKSWILDAEDLFDDAIRIRDYNESRFGNGDYKIFLRSFDQITDEEIMRFGTTIFVGKDEALVYRKDRYGWYMGSYNISELDPNDFNDVTYILSELESNDTNNVISINRGGILSYGYDDENQHFVDLSTQIKWVNYLRSIGIDCDGILESPFGIKEVEK